MNLDALKDIQGEGTRSQADAKSVAGKFGNRRISVDHSKPYFELLRRVEEQFGRITRNYDRYPKELRELFRRNGGGFFEPALEITDPRYSLMLLKRYGVVEEQMERTLKEIRGDGYKAKKYAYDRTAPKKPPVQQQKLTEAKLKDGLERGLTANEISIVNRVSISTVYTALKRHGLKPPGSLRDK